MTESISNEQSDWMREHGVKRKNVPYPASIDLFIEKYGITEANVPAARIARKKREREIQESRDRQKYP